MFGVTQGQGMAPTAQPLPLLLLHHIRQFRQRPLIFRYHRYHQPYIRVIYNNKNKKYTTTTASTKSNNTTNTANCVTTTKVLASTGIRFIFNPTSFVTNNKNQNSNIVADSSDFGALYSISSSKTENSLSSLSSYTGWLQNRGSS